MSSAPAVLFDDVCKSFGSRVAVQDVSFQVDPGRIVALLGPNGAGKTTSLRIALGLVTPTSGRATVLGHDFASLPDAGRRVGLAMDGIGAVRGATGRRELEIWARATGVSRRRVDDVLGLVELTDAARRRVAKYSTGMKQRLALATALLADPEVLVLDEPTNGLDPEGIRWLRGLLRGFADEGRTVLISTHILSELSQHIDDVVVLDTTLRFDGTLDEFTSSGAVSVEDRYFELVSTRRPEGSHHA